MENHRKMQESRDLLNRAYQTYLEHLPPVTAPLALISQIQRSGGSMLSQLFDGHPEVHAHPHELKIGYPKKFNWPEINGPVNQTRGVGGSPLTPSCCSKT